MIIKISNFHCVFWCNFTAIIKGTWIYQNLCRKMFKDNSTMSPNPNYLSPEEGEILCTTFRFSRCHVFGAPSSLLWIFYQLTAGQNIAPKVISISQTAVYCTSKHNCHLSLQVELWMAEWLTHHIALQEVMGSNPFMAEERTCKR